jgi:hypothetical protein
MNKLFKFSILLVCFLSAVNVASAQKVKLKSKTAPKAVQTKIDLGILRQNTYINDFFELKVEFPYGWLVGDNMLEAQLMEIKKQTIQAANPKDQKSLIAAMNRIVPLLGGYKALPGSSAENSSLRIVVESVAAAPGIKTSRDYLNKVLSSIDVVKMPQGFTVSGIKEEEINGKKLDYIETKYLTSQKRNYVMIKKGYAVLISIDSYNQADFDALHKVLTEADLNYKKEN